MLDAALPGDLGVGIQALLGVAPRVAVIVLTYQHDDALLLAAVRAGATGYLVSDMDAGQLAHAVAATATGEALIPRRFVGHLLDELRHEPGARPGTSVDTRLTERERQVLDLLRAGLPTTSIAERLYVAPVTVRTHIASIVHKLHVTDRDALRGRTSHPGVQTEPGGHGERPDA